MPKFALWGWTILVSLAAGAALAQTPDPTAAPKPALAFEVATIKPAEPLTPALVASGKLHVGFSVDGARVDIGFFTLSDLIRTAYKLKAYQVDGPEWLTAQRFDILAKMPEGATKEQVPEMLQALLADRFKLTTHRGTKEHSVLALVVAKGGVKMKEAAPDADVPPPADDDKKGGVVVGAGSQAVRIRPSGDGRGATISGGAAGGMKMSPGPNGSMHMEFQKMAMDGLVEFVARFVDKPVIDATELKGKYQMALDLSLDDLKSMAARAGVAPFGAPDASRPPAESASDPTGSIYSALSALGLKLEARKAPIEALIVDHVEKMPTEN